MRHVALTLSALASVAVGAVQAQDAHASREAPPAATSGPAAQTVRVHLRNRDTLQGYLRGRSADEIVIYTSEGRYRHVPLADIQRFEVQSRTGSHLKRGAFIGVLVWGSIMGAAALGALDEAGVASWQSGAILAGSTGLGAIIGAQVPRHGWRVAEPSSVARPAPAPGIRLTLLTLRF
jgi:hypothetical protein